MFFTFFKNDGQAHQIYEMLTPIVSEHFDVEQNQIIDPSDLRANDSNKFVRIHLLTQFIDLFNFYPAKVGKLRYKNDSNEFTYVMNSGTKG
jgi:hypothetical protein